MPTDVILFVLSNSNNYSPSGRKEESQYSRKVPEKLFLPEFYLKCKNVNLKNDKQCT